MRQVLPRFGEARDDFDICSGSPSGSAHARPYSQLGFTAPKSHQMRLRHEDH